MKRRGFLGLMGAVIGAKWLELPMWAKQKILFKTGDRHPDPNMNNVVFVQYCENGHPIWTSDYRDPDAPYRLRAKNGDKIPCSCTPYIKTKADEIIEKEYPGYHPSIKWQKPWWQTSSPPPKDECDEFWNNWSFASLKKEVPKSPWITSR